MTDRSSIGAQSPLHEGDLLRNGRLSMGKVLVRAVVTLFRHAPIVVLTMVIPVLLMTILQQLLTGSPFLVEALVSALAWLLLWVGFASVLHARFLGLKVAPWRAIVWTRAQVSFLLGILKLIGVMILLGILISLLAIIPFGNLVGFLISAFVWARCSMVFPSAAVGRPLDLGGSWELTAAQRGRVALLIGALYIVVQVVMSFLIAWPALSGSLSGLYPEIANPLTTSIVANALMFLVAAVVVSVLSATYRGLVQMRPAEVRDQYIPDEGSHLVDVF